MAEGNLCVASTRDADARFIHLRVRYSAIKDLPDSGSADILDYAYASTELAGCKCTAFCVGSKGGSIYLAFLLHNGPNPTPPPAGEPRVMVNMVLLDRTGSAFNAAKPGPVRASKRRWRGGIQLQARRADVEVSCVADDGCFVALCYVTVLKDGDRPPPPPQEQLARNLAAMLASQDHTDVSFRVDGETFAAHRLVLAAQSPVFRAELFGAMAECNMSSIAIQDMRASTFRSMLHFMYGGSLPSAAVDGDAASAAVELQHLFVAADRYGLETLKQVCEEKLGGSVTADTVLSTLELAEHHGCHKLKARCLDFLADSANFEMVATTDEYLQSMHTAPCLFQEVRSRLKRKREPESYLQPSMQVNQKSLTSA